jgi:hypothetical protein
MMNLHGALEEAGFKTNTHTQEFLETYSKAHEKYRVVRYGKLGEVTNTVWVSEMLCNLGYKVQENDPDMKAALNVFFQNSIDSLELRDCAKKLQKNSCNLQARLSFQLYL